jgi:hypothetical protein
LGFLWLPRSNRRTKLFKSSIFSINLRVKVNLIPSKFYKPIKLKFYSQHIIANIYKIRKKEKNSTEVSQNKERGIKEKSWPILILINAEKSMVKSGSRSKFGCVKSLDHEGDEYY